jgi:ligand-binding sensor domain-containing protein
MINRFLLFIILITSFTAAHAQNLPIGGWAALLPYRFATGVVQGNGKIYCITSIDIFSVNTSDNSIQEYNKVTGLSGTDISAIAYNSAHGVLVIGYTNSNVDLLYDNGKVINVPAIEQATIVGNRAINSIYFIGPDAYLSCGFGVINLNLDNQLINDTYYFVNPKGSPISVNSVSLLSDTIYAATNDGVYYANLNDSLSFQNFDSTWHYFTNVLPVANTQFVQSFNNRMYALQNSTQNASVYKYSNNNWSKIYSGLNWTINGVTASSANLVLAEDSGNVYKSEINLINSSGNSTPAVTSGLGLPIQALQDNSGNLWIADFYDGLLRYNNGSIQNFTPNGPFTTGDNGIAAYNNNVYVAPDGAANSFSTNGFFVRSNNFWVNVNQNVNSQMNAVYNVTNVIASPAGDTAYFGTFSDGVIQYIHSSNAYTLKIYNASNSTLTTQIGNSSNLNIGGMAYDNENNLWISDYGAQKPIAVLEANGTWQSFQPNVSIEEGWFTGIAVDQFDQKWIINTPGNGLIVMNTGTDLSNISNPVYKALGTGVGNGNLPSSDVTSLAVDQTGNVWVGTNEGITIFYCPGDELTTTGCDAQQPIYSTSAGNGYLLGTDVINSIVVDGANRKWVGTNTGVYLLSADGSQEIENFTAQNSPLFSNNIISLALDPATGILYIGTDQGILEYRTTATAGSQTNCTVSVFPDPVRPNYYGPITVVGVVANATVKITDVTGDLVYETTALGGQAIWNGNLQNGNRAKTGVYLVFVSSSDGTVHCMGKFLLIN